MKEFPSRIKPWNNAKPSASRLTCWWRSKAVGPPGQTRAILLVMISPKIIDSHSRPKATKPLDLDRYQ